MVLVKVGAKVSMPSEKVDALGLDWATGALCCGLRHIPWFLG